MKILRYSIILVFLILLFRQASAAYILIPMDDTQKNHLKAYGIAYWVLTYDVEIYWLLNYRGGSYMFLHIKHLKTSA
jgi:hypothetical protein